MRAHQLQDTALRYFLEVAQCGSITEASARLHVAASALSRQIAGLEAQLGAPLFERHPRGMVLTEAGEILARHARRAHLDAERALGEIGALRGLRAGQVRLATSDAFANELVPRLCARFQQAHQGIRFSVQVLPTAEVPGAVRGGAADIGLCFSRAPEKDIEVAYRQSAPVQALLPPATRWRGRAASPSRAWRATRWPCRRPRPRCARWSTWPAAARACGWTPCW